MKNNFENMKRILEPMKQVIKDYEVIYKSAGEYLKSFNPLLSSMESVNRISDSIDTNAFDTVKDSIENMNVSVKSLRSILQEQENEDTLKSVNTVINNLEESNILLENSFNKMNDSIKSLIEILNDNDINI